MAGDDGELDVHVRAGDQVVVVLRGDVQAPCGCVNEVTQRFWCDVCAVLPFGEVVAVPQKPLRHFPVGPHVGPVHFPATRILAAGRGPYW